MRRSKDEVWDLLEYVKGELGTEETLKNICLALSTDDLDEVLSFIVRMFDLDPDGEEEKNDD